MVRAEEVFRDRVTVPVRRSEKSDRLLHFKGRVAAVERLFVRMLMVDVRRVPMSVVARLVGMLMGMPAGDWWIVGVSVMLIVMAMGMVVNDLIVMMHMNMLLEYRQKDAEQHQTGRRAEYPRRPLLQDQHGKQDSDKRSRRVKGAGSGGSQITLCLDVKEDAQPIGDKTE